MNTFKNKNNKNTYSVDQAKKAILDIIKLETRPIKDFVLLRKIILGLLMENLTALDI